MPVLLMSEAGTRHEWYALRVRSNFEHYVWTALEGKGADAFLPTYSKRTKGSRCKPLQLPLFPGYVFGCFDLRHRLPILTTPGIMGIVGYGKIPVAVAPWEIENVRRFVASGKAVMPWPLLTVGDIVTVEYGALAGIEGILVEVKNECRLVISVTLLQRSVAVEIDREWIRPRAVRRIVTAPTRREPQPPLTARV